MPLQTPDAPALITRGMRACSLFREWPEPALALVSAGSHLNRYARGAQVLAHAPQQCDVFVIVSGSLQLSGYNVHGTRFVLTRFGAGEIVGLVRLLPGHLSVYDYNALDPTLLIHIPADHLRAVLDAHPQLWRDVALLALSRQQDSIVALQRRGFRRNEQSLAQALLRLLQMQGSDPGAGSGIRLRVSQNDLAAMVSVSRQTVNKELRQLSSLGVVSVSYGELAILDLPVLQRLAETGSLPAQRKPKE